MRTCALFLLGAWMCCVACTSEQNSKVNINVVRADSLLNQVLALYEVKEYGLLLENYPPKENERATYLADETQQKTNQRVSYLWPYSGMVSGCVSLYKTTGDEKYKQLLENRILPGLEKYWDGKREPYCYQSYPMQFGYSDRYYDDNDWLAIDLCDYYALTKDPAVLERAKELHRYIYSGWDEVLGGGIYWCEQKKLSKNTCSNAPATVLCMKLYNLTSDPDYLDLAKKTYRWTKENLCDPSDGVYWDNINLEGNIAKQKYTYNSGQMIQAGVLLFQATGDSTYLKDAQVTAKGAHGYFRKMQPVQGGEAMFYTSSPWFNVILFRGLKALYEVDKNPVYVKAMMENTDYAWKETRDEHGLLNGDWSGKHKDEHKWLLNNACMVEMYSEAAQLDW